MGILKRIWNWLCSLFGGRKKDEITEFERCVSQMQEVLRNMKAQTEAVLAAQDKRKRERIQCEEQIARMERYAEKAAAGGDDRNARIFLEKKEALLRQLDEFTKQSEAAAGYTYQAQNLYRKAESQLNEITARKDAVKAKMAAAQLQEAMNQLESGRLGGSLDAQAAEAQAALDKAEALAELESRTGDSDMEALMRKYDEEEGAGTETSKDAVSQA